MPGIYPGNPSFPGHNSSGSGLRGAKVYRYIDDLWPHSQAALAEHLERLQQADGGRHWQHTLRALHQLDWLIGDSIFADAPAWLANPPPVELLRSVLLLHDLGKYVDLSCHPEISFRLVAQATDSYLPPGSDQALTAIAIRHHADFSALQSGEASELISYNLALDRQQYRLDTEKFLAVLTWVTVADWTAYDLLTPPAFQGLVEQVGYIRRYAAEPLPALADRLYRRARQRAAQRIGLLAAFAFSLQPVTAAQWQQADAIITSVISQEGLLSWPEFQQQFALLVIDGGYSVFTRCGELAGAFEQQLTFVLRQLGRWLSPSPPKYDLKTNRFLPVLVNLRPVTRNLSQKSLDQIDEELAHQPSRQKAF